MSPTTPVQTNPQQQNQTAQPTATPDQVIMNLQKAIEDARRKSSQFNGVTNTANIPSVQAGMNDKR
jgi:hypothetical protein